MFYTNACVYLPEGRFQRRSFRVEEGRFAAISGETPPEGIDLMGALVLPGLVDIHTHGCGGADCSDADAQGLRRMGRFYLDHGVTSFCPTSMTLPYDRLAAACSAAVAYEENRPRDGARMMGVHMEGPFLSEKKKGAQNAAFLQKPDVAAFDALYKGCGGRIAIVDVAPELPGALDFIRGIRDRCVVSLAHTEADYDQARSAFEAGATHVTHLFNAMTPLHHRLPGVIGAAAEREDVGVELIADGLHVHPSVIRAAFRLFPRRLALISDSIRCCGMADGAYELGGLSVTLKGNAATLADGTIAGSATDLFTCLKNVIRFGIPREEAIAAATLIPARQIRQDGDIGSIHVGAFADFLLCDEALNLQAVYLGGQRVARKG